MIEIHSLQEGAPVQLSPADGRKALGDRQSPLWINLINPTPDECAEIGAHYDIPGAHLEAALDANERSRLESDASRTLIVARTPFRHDPVHRVTHSTCPIAAIITRNALVTVCLKDHIAANLLRGPILGSGAHLATRLALTLLLRVSISFIEQLQSMDAEIGRLEQALRESMRNEGLLSMLHLEKSMIYFMTALKGNQSVMEKMRSLHCLSTTPEDAALLDDVLIENRQATDMAGIYTQIMGSLSDAFGAIVSNNLNKVMKVLTGLTIVFMIPTIIGALYGMNVVLPFADSPYAFAGLCLACLGGAGAVFCVLKIKDWM